MNNLISKKNNLIMYFALFLITLSLFSYEILLTRLFSVILSHNLVFLVVSFAILGNGLGGIFTYRQLSKNSKIDIKVLISKLSIVLFISIFLTIIIIYKMPYINIYSIYALIGIIPFVIGGSILSIIFKEFANVSSKVYFMDLVGSAIGSIGIIILMNLFGFMYSVTIITILAIIASISISLYCNQMKLILINGVLLAILSIVLIEGNFIIGLEKGFSSYFSSPNTVIKYIEDMEEESTDISYTKWNAVSRTDVIETTDKNQKIIVTDGGASAPIIKFNGNLSEVEYLKSEVNYIPFAIGDNDKTLVIGSGGGKDVLFALLGGSNEISAVEINKSTIDAVDYFKEYSGNIYDRAEVKVYNQDGRNFVENTFEKFNNIYLSMVMTNSIENTMYSLSENYLFTEEAFQTYLNKLEKNGKLSIMTHSALEMLRIVNTGIKVLLDNGVKESDITNYFIIVNGMNKIHTNSHGNIIRMPMIIFKNVPFTDNELMSLEMISNSQNRDIIHQPNKEYKLYNLLKTNQLSYQEMLETFTYNVKPIVDNSPFFYNYTNFVPSEIIVIGVVALFIWIIIRSIYFKEKIIRRVSTYFIILGMAFMLVEIPLVQKTILYFGNSSIAFSSMLFSILVSSGIGSLLSGNKLIKKSIINSRIYLLLAGISVLGVLISIDRITSITNDLDLIYKIIVIFIVVFPMGFFMGMPFPIGINKIKEELGKEKAIPLMWAANGIFSVIGSILAVSLSMKFGFNITILIGAILYLFLYIKGVFNI